MTSRAALLLVLLSSTRNCPSSASPIGSRTRIQFDEELCNAMANELGVARG